MKTIIVIPTYNEAQNAPLIAAQVAQALPEAHLLLVDDASPDGTADLADRLFASDPIYSNYRVFRRTGVRGLGRAYRDAFIKVLGEGYDRIIHMDADLSHDPSYLPAMLAASQDADLVIGSRYAPQGGVRNWPRYRVLMSRFANRYVQSIAGIPVADATSGFRCWTSRALEAVHMESFKSEGYSFQVEMSYRASRAGMKIVEVPIIFTDRQFGQSKISRKVLIESAIIPWKLRAQSWQPLPKHKESH